jgi:hypothetical protein
MHNQKFDKHASTESRARARARAKEKQETKKIKGSAT